MKNLLNKLYRPIKSIDDKVLKWYSDKWEKHPKLTPALTFLSLATLQTALGVFIGDKLGGGVTVNPHWENIYERVQVGETTKRVWDPFLVPVGKYLWDIGGWKNVTVSIYENVKTGEYWVEGGYYPLGAFIGGMSGFLSSILTKMGLSDLVQHYKKNLQNTP